MEFGRYWHSIVVLRDNPIVFGGVGTKAIDKCEKYDVSAAAWSEIASLPKPMARGHATVHESKIYLSEFHKRSVIKYNPDKDRFKKAPFKLPIGATFSLGLSTGNSLWFITNTGAVSVKEKSADYEAERNVECPNSIHWIHGPPIARENYVFWMQ
jgi:streptogramin lyase